MIEPMSSIKSEITDPVLKAELDHVVGIQRHHLGHPHAGVYHIGERIAAHLDLDPGAVAQAIVAAAKAAA